MTPLNSRIIYRFKDDLTGLEVLCWQFWKTLVNGKKTDRIYSVEATYNGKRVMYEGSVKTAQACHQLGKRTYKVLRIKFREVIDTLPGGA